MAARKKSKKAPRSTPNQDAGSASDPVRESLNKLVDELVASGRATRLSKKEWAAIRDNSEAHGCILIPKGTVDRTTTSPDQNN